MTLLKMRNKTNISYGESEVITIRDMVKCEKCGKWYSYKYECGCDNRVDPRDKFLKKYSIKNGDEVEFINGLVTRFDTYSYGHGSNFHVIHEKTYPRRNFTMIHINQIVEDLNEYQIVRINDNVME